MYELRARFRALSLCLYSAMEIYSGSFRKLQIVFGYFGEYALIKLS